MELLEPLRDKLFMYALALEKNPYEAEDLSGDTILACYEYFPKFRDYDGFKGYLFKTARNLFRRKKRRAKIFGAYEKTRENNIKSQDISPELPYDIEMLYKALADLPDKQNEAVVLFEISGFSLKEIQKIQGGTLSAVKSRIKRGREKLSEILCGSGNEKSNIIKMENSYSVKSKAFL